MIDSDDFKGSVDGWDFKQYILGIMLYYISENRTKYINDGERKFGDTDFNYALLTDEETETIRSEIVNEKVFLCCRQNYIQMHAKKLKMMKN